MNENYPIVPLIRDQEFQSPTEPGFYGTATTPDGSVFQTLDPGGVAEQVVEMHYLPSAHLTMVHYKHVNAQYVQDNSVTDGEILSLIGEAFQAVPDGAVSFRYTKLGSALPPVDVAFAYRGLHTKIGDGTVSENILMHGGNLVTDSKDCFILGKQRAEVQDHQGVMEKGLVSSQEAKSLFEAKMAFKPINLAVSNGPGIRTSAASA